MFRELNLILENWLFNKIISFLLKYILNTSHWNYKEKTYPNITHSKYL